MSSKQAFSNTPLGKRVAKNPQKYLVLIEDLHKDLSSCETEHKNLSECLKINNQAPPKCMDAIQACLTCFKNYGVIFD